MAEFVRAQIFGTTFEITSRSVLRRTHARARRAVVMTDGHPLMRVVNRYTDLQPVGMGAFGLVWYDGPARRAGDRPSFCIDGLARANGPRADAGSVFRRMQFGQGSVDRLRRGGQEDHEAL